MTARTATLILSALALLAPPMHAQETKPEAAEPSKTDRDGEASEAHRAGLARLESVLRVLSVRPHEFAEENFTPDLRQRRSVRELQEAFETLARSDGGYEAMGIIDHAPGVVTTVIRAKGTGSRSRLTVMYETSDPFRIDGLLLHPDLPSFGGWGEFTRRLDAFEGEASVVVARLIEDGTTETIFAHRADEQLNIAQHARLFVLHALMTAIDAGVSDWLTTLRVRDQLKSLPPSETKEADEGAAVPLTILAHRMLADNDMTAMDHLIDYLDKRTIQNLMARRVASMDRNIPFLTSLESYTLRLVLSREYSERWANADDEQQGAILDEIKGLRVAPEGFASWARPIDVPVVGWFASAEQINDLMADVYVAAHHPGLRHALSAIQALPEAPVDPTVWTRSRLIQSYEPGVFASTWILTHRDGRMFLMTGVFNNEASAFPPAQAGTLLVAAAETLARTDPRTEAEATPEEEPDPDAETPGSGG